MCCVARAIFAQTCHDLGWLYNWAFLVPDADSFGVATIQKLMDLQYPVELLYRRRRDADDQRPPTMDELGFLTTVTSKPQCIDKLDWALRNQEITIVDGRTLDELRSFVNWPDGKQAAQPGSHDDLVMALAYTVWGIPWAIAAHSLRAAAEKGKRQLPFTRYGGAAGRQNLPFRM